LQIKQLYKPEFKESKDFAFLCGSELLPKPYCSGYAQRVSFLKQFLYILRCTVKEEFHPICQNGLVIVTVKLLVRKGIGRW